MSRWFRHYAGMMRDEKLVRVSIKSGQPIERVVWIWGAILESAAEIDDGGRYDIDPAEVAYFLRADEADVAAVLAALAGAARVAEGRVVHWGDRQFVSDRSATRVAAHRERKRAEQRGSDDPQGNDTVTLQQPRGNAPETETELETEVVPNGTTARAPRARACRIPIDWKPAPLPPKIASLTAQWPPGREERELDGFRDYWTARVRDAARSDWNITWHNRIRDQHDRILRENRNARQRSPAPTNGIAAALDRRIEPGGFAGQAGRYDLGGGRDDRALPAPPIAIVR